MRSSLRRVMSASLAGGIALASTMSSSAADEPMAKPQSATGEPKGPQSVAVDPKGKPQSVAVDLKRLEMELELYAAEANRRRLASALTGLGVGAALVPSGLVLLGRTDGISRALVIGMIVGGSAQLASVPLLLIPTRMDEIRDQFMSRPANMENKATIREIENEWRLAAETSRRKRAYVGTTMLIVGAISLGTGLSLLLAPEGILGMSRTTQYTWGGVLMGSGVPVTTIGVRFLLEWSLEETSWEAYRTMKADANSLGRLRSPSIGVSPTPGGALAFASMSF
jgi:hypothetical protein